LFRGALLPKRLVEACVCFASAGLRLLQALPACLCPACLSPQLHMVCLPIDRPHPGSQPQQLALRLCAVASVLPLQNGSVAEAISLWKRNVDKEFEGAGLRLAYFVWLLVFMTAVSPHPLWACVPCLVEQCCEGMWEDC